MTRFLFLILLVFVIATGCISPGNPDSSSQAQIAIQSADSYPVLEPVNASAGWQSRAGHSSVVMPDGSIVLMGGFIDGESNDTWRSTDNGKTWTLLTAHAPWTARSGHSSIVLPDGSIILTGGSAPGGQKNDTWRSADLGATWELMTTHAEWQARTDHSSVIMPDGRIVLMGGVDYSKTPFVYKFGYFYNDVWTSTDNGKTWKEVNTSAGWSPRWGQTSVVMPDGSIILMGGEDGSFRNDVWRSTDYGETWALSNASASWSPRIEFCSVITPDGSIILMGGADNHNDVWRSNDNGVTWKPVTTNATWTSRHRHSCVAMPDGRIILMGGTDASRQRQNDVWLSKDEGTIWTQIKASDSQVI